MVWQTKKLEDCLDKIIYTNKIQKKDFLTSGLYPIVSQESEKINGFWNDEADLFKCKTPVVVFGDHTQVLKYVDFDFVLGADGVKILQPDKILDSRFFYYFLNSIYLKSLGYARHYRLLKKIGVPIPSLSEQQRIVKILDGVFKNIAKVKANTEKNLQNSKDLFEAYLQNVFANPGDDWKEKIFDEIIESNVIGLVKNRKEQSDDAKYKYVKMNNITRDNNFDFSKYTRVNATEVEIEKYCLLKDDFLFNTRNSYELVGKTCIFEGDDEKDVLFNNNIMRVRFGKRIVPHFINYVFSSKIIIDKIKHLKSGTTNVSAIYYKDLKNLIFPVPSFNEQKSIVKKLDALSEQTKKLGEIYKKKLEDLEELKKSVLQKAFAGEL